MTKGTIPLVFVGLMLVSPQVFAEWSQLAETNQSVQFIDRGSIQKTQMTYKVWWLMNLKPHIQSQVSFASVVGYEEVDCKSNQTRSSQKTTYNQLFGQGIGIPSNLPESWNSPRPGSFQENLLKTLCQSQ